MSRRMQHFFLNRQKFSPNNIGRFAAGADGRESGFLEARLSKAQRSYKACGDQFESLCASGQIFTNQNDC
jgi:hypothetical protein